MPKSDQGSGTSAPYNMALVGYASRSEFGLSGFTRNGRRPVYRYEARGPIVDKLRLRGVVTVDPAAFPQHIMGLRHHASTRGRRKGPFVPNVEKCWTKPRDEDGGIYWQLSHIDGRHTHDLVAEFNPAKFGDVEWGCLGATLAVLGFNADRFDRLVVDRFDGAIGYVCPRHVVLLDDRQRLADYFGVGPRGPQTERTGFRRGSPLKHQLYDKRAERASKGVDLPDDETRYEVQVLKPASLRPAAPLFGQDGEDELLRLADLEHVAWPGGDVTVRCLPHHPGRVADRAFGMLAGMARGIGIRAALNYAKEACGWPSDKRRQWLETMVPVVDPSPADVWASGWRREASAVVERVRGAVAAKAYLGREASIA